MSDENKSQALTLCGWCVTMEPRGEIHAAAKRAVKHIRVEPEYKVSN